MSKLTGEKVKNSPEYKEYITGKVFLIENVLCANNENDYAVYIVIHSEFGKWTITRFYNSRFATDKILAITDYVDISFVEVFKALLSDYSINNKNNKN